VVSVVRPRRGGTKGCLLSLLIFAGLCYFAINVAEAGLRFYRYQDAMRQHVRFAASRSDDAIKARLAAFADSLGLPPEAHKVKVVRRGRTISISAEYTELVDLPFVKREIDLSPHSSGTF
jgi:hypothetical protein